MKGYEAGREAGVDYTDYTYTDFRLVYSHFAACRENKYVRANEARASRWHCSLLFSRLMMMSKWMQWFLATQPVVKRGIFCENVCRFVYLSVTLVAHP